uniref:Sm domain-containing protein n=1 Tax=Setaria digitata TaxID=48799 RepID=A0A915PJV8_9BILA
MACLLQAMEGTCVVIELKNYFLVQGTLGHCDDAMNIDLKAVTIHGLKHHNEPLHCDNFHVRGKFIRFIHFDHYFNAAKIIHKSLNASRKFGRSLGRKRIP